MKIFVMVPIAAGAKNWEFWPKISFRAWKQSVDNVCSVSTTFLSFRSDKHVYNVDTLLEAEVNGLVSSTAPPQSSGLRYWTIPKLHKKFNLII